MGLILISGGMKTGGWGKEKLEVEVGRWCLALLRYTCSAFFGE